MSDFSTIILYVKYLLHLNGNNKVSFWKDKKNMRVKVFVSEIILIGFVYFLIENKRNEKKKKDRFALILLTLSKF
jgi:predicted nucleic-acid-binding protein